MHVQHDDVETDHRTERGEVCGAKEACPDECKHTIRADEDEESERQARAAKV